MSKIGKITINWQKHSQANQTHNTLKGTVRRVPRLVPREALWHVPDALRDAVGAACGRGADAALLGRACLQPQRAHRHRLLVGCGLPALPLGAEGLGHLRRASGADPAGRRKRGWYGGVRYQVFFSKSAFSFIFGLLFLCLFK